MNESIEAVEYRFLQYLYDSFNNDTDIEIERLPEIIKTAPEVIKYLVNRLNNEKLIDGVNVMYAGDEIYSINYANLAITDKGMEKLAKHNEPKDNANSTTEWKLK
jgi:RIO-like serine/threonine protein kinase